MSRLLSYGLRTVRRVIVAVLGITVVFVGVALMVLPGPAFIVIPIGLGILALEFAWARRLLRRAREFYGSSVDAPISGGAEAAPRGEALQSQAESVDANDK